MVRHIFKSAGNVRARKATRHTAPMDVVEFSENSLGPPAGVFEFLVRVIKGCLLDAECNYLALLSPADHKELSEAPWSSFLVGYLCECRYIYSSDEKVPVFVLDNPEGVDRPLHLPLDHAWLKRLGVSEYPTLDQVEFGVDADDRFYGVADVPIQPALLFANHQAAMWDVVSRGG